MSQKPPQISSLNRVMSLSGNASFAATSASLIDKTVGYAATTTAFNTPSYHELLENPHVELDGLQRLQENLAQLEDLHGRLQFMMRDISGLIRRR